MNMREEVARSRFELLSRDPESRMIDRYTTGLSHPHYLPFSIINLTDSQKKGRDDEPPANQGHFPHALHTVWMGRNRSPRAQNGSMSSASLRK